MGPSRIAHDEAGDGGRRLADTTDPVDLASLAAAVGALDTVVDAAGIPFQARAWGDVGDPPLLLVHGLGASSTVWWQVGPALAKDGRRIVAVDLPGHGRTGHWAGHHRFRDTSLDLLA